MRLLLIGNTAWSGNYRLKIISLLRNFRATAVIFYFSLKSDEYGGIFQTNNFIYI